MTNTTSKLLFELLNRGLAPDRHIPKGEQLDSIGHPDRKAWLSLITLAEQNEISGLVYDSVQTLPQDQQPDFEVMMRWTASIQSMERDNLLYLKHLFEVFDCFEKQQLHPIVMKGVTLSQLYPNPLHRSVGDVDLFVPLDQQHRFSECLTSMDGEVDTHFDTKHTTAKCNGLNWELHFRTMHFYNNRIDKRYNLFEQEETSIENLFHTEINKHQVLIFPPVFNIIYLTAHFQHHLLMERISLRQVVDWALVLHHERIALGIAETNLVQTLTQLGLYRLYKALGYIAIQYFGYSAKGYAGLTALTTADKLRGRLILRALITGHLPGCKPFIPRLDSDSWTKRLHHFFELCKRCFVLFELSPLETISTPFGFIHHAIKRRQWKSDKKQ